MGEKRKISAAQVRAVSKYEKKAYFKAMVRFKKEDEAAIREAAGDSLNAFIVGAVLDAVNAKTKNAENVGSENAENPDGENAKTQNAKTLESENAKAQKNENAKTQNQNRENAQIAETQKRKNAKTENAKEEDAIEPVSIDGNCFRVPRGMVEEMRLYGNPLDILIEGAEAVLAEYRSGLR